MTGPSRPTLAGSFGMVTSTHWLASQTGMAMLERRGNAFDAATAAGFVLQVAQPHLNGPAGEVPILVHDARSGRVQVVAGQGTAPAAASLDHFAALGLTDVPGTGLLAATVPAAFRSWLTLLRDFGTMRVRDVLEPAAHYARVGVPVTPQIAATIASIADLAAAHWPTTAAAYVRGGGAPPVGSVLLNPMLADTLDRLIAAAEASGPGREAQIEGALRAFYGGFVAEAIDAFVRTPARDETGADHAGLLTGDDLARWVLPIEDPVSVRYGDHEVFKTGPWGQGPVFLQQLKLLQGFDLGALDPTGPDFVHVVVECAKLAFADREAHYGDPDVVAVPVDVLLSDSYADERRALVGPEASADLRPGSIDGYPGRLPSVLPIDGEGVGAGAGRAAGTGEPTVWLTPETGGDTCHLDAVDRWGNLVAATPSGGWLQSSPVIPALGFPLGTRLQMARLEPGLAATLVPGSRPRTTLSPTIAFRNGQPYLAFGTPGGDQQDQWSLVPFLLHVHHGLPLQEALEAPLFDTRHPPSSFAPRTRAPRTVVMERRFPAATVDELRRRGHDVAEVGPWTLGRVTAVAIDPPFLRAAASPRGLQAYAVGR